MSTRQLVEVFGAGAALSIALLAYKASNIDVRANILMGLFSLSLFAGGLYTLVIRRHHGASASSPSLISGLGMIWAGSLGSFLLAAINFNIAPLMLIWGVIGMDLGLLLLTIIGILLSQRS